MTRENVINNIMATYVKYGFTREVIEEQIVSGEKHGFSYQTIYTGLRMTLGGVTGEQRTLLCQNLQKPWGNQKRLSFCRLRRVKRIWRRLGRIRRIILEK